LARLKRSGTGLGTAATRDGGKVCLGEQTLAEGELITLDGNDGAVYRGAARIVGDVPQALVQRLTGRRLAPDGPGPVRC